MPASEQADQLELEDGDEPPVRVVKASLICPRCGARTKGYEIAEGARGVRKLCGNCRKLDPDGMPPCPPGCTVPVAAKPRPRAFYCVISPEAAVWCCNKEMLAIINANGMVGVMLPRL
jgi:hypothetical protein